MHIIFPAKLDEQGKAIVQATIMGSLCRDHRRQGFYALCRRSPSCSKKPQVRGVVLWSVLRTLNKTQKNNKIFCTLHTTPQWFGLNMSSGDNHMPKTARNHAKVCTNTDVSPHANRARLKASSLHPPLGARPASAPMGPTSENK